MSAGADIYQQLLGIGPAVPRPMTIYGLLGTADFEANAALLLQRVEQQRRKLAGYTQPELQPAVTRLREMLAKAEQVIRSPELKARYDAKLRGTPTPPPVAVPLAIPQTASPPLTAAPPVIRQAPAPPSPMAVAVSVSSDQVPQIQVAPTTVRPNAARLLKKRSLAGSPIVWGLAGLGIAAAIGITVWLWPRDREAIAKAEKPTPPAEVPVAPQPLRPTPQPVPPVDQQPAVSPTPIPTPVPTPEPEPEPEPEPDPRRVGKILSTAAAASNYLIKGQELQVSKTKAHDEYFVFGDEQWQNYDLEFETCVDTAGTAICSLGIAIRCPDDNVLGSVETLWDAEPRVKMRLLERGKGDDYFLDYGGDRKATLFAPGMWQKFHVSVRGKQVTVQRNGQDVLNQRVEYLPHRGKVGFHVGCIRDCVTRFRNIKVRDAEGNELWDGLPALDRNYTARQPRKAFTEPVARLDPAKIQRRELPEKLEALYRFEGQNKKGWASPQEIADAENYWFIEEGKLTNKTGQARGYSALRLDQPPLKNFVFKARLKLVADAFHLYFRTPLFEYHKGVEFVLARDGTSGIFRYPTWKNESTWTAPPNETFDFEMIAAEDCFEAKIDGRTINLHRPRIGAPQQGSLWISSQGGKPKVVIEQLEVFRLPDDFRRLAEPAATANDEQIVWKYDGGQFERQPNSSWIASNIQGERAVYLEKIRNDYQITLQSLDGKTRIRLLDTEAEMAAGPFLGSPNDHKKFIFQHAGQFVGKNLRQVPPTDPTLTAEAALASATLAPTQDAGAQTVLNALAKEQALVQQQTQLLFQTYYQELKALVDPRNKRETRNSIIELEDYVSNLHRTAQFAKKPQFLAVAADFYEFNVKLLTGINENQARLNRFYADQVAQLTAEGKTDLAQRLQEAQRRDPLAQPLQLFTVRYMPSQVDEEVSLTCLSNFTIAEYPKQRLSWVFSNANEIIIQGADADGKIVWRDSLKISYNEARNPLFFRYGQNKTGKLYSVVPRGLEKK